MEICVTLYNDDLEKALVRCSDGYHIERNKHILYVLDGYHYDINNDICLQDSD